VKQSAQEKPQTGRETFGPWQLLIALLSVYTLVALSYEQFGRPPEDIRFLLGIFDYVVCTFFMTDFIRQLVKAKPKSAYLKYGWIDFISSIPAFPMLMWARVFRFLRLLKIATTLHSWRQIADSVFKNRATGVAAVGVATVIAVVFIGAIVILEVEKGPEANIQNGSDALWWAMTTVTTVGYGDRYPVTDPGRLFGAFLMIVGIGVYGTITGLFATWFISGANKE
jgi:voltage-gated potassium channel